ncbi:MAG: PfkB family carbohydrate kinase [Candidatus Thiodiazotropha lotti]|uniref:Carbohydrate kinase PfkB domain-containing protein n=1 Tax=Candidatus Thiodiazotropha endoloripes TaxID=1818881 RepID=A0A1E2UM23_9GAMM|nr:PfkB family carbohydrate kinase [Candidatus Thiodiazotropha endoloripes]MCG7897039.1 PfkB family carbohydrate kinase [Candidatus Thiodiazotropha weberae]MCG7991699.1 PfkB family carbohydrate kinase [Candidatus Thiodiazotropha lotti]MCG7904485.1 PfkB family carbohydrate kinase [Candidatus Thiodiazotropha weberae]MCG7999723.1 PfkB family carbohydrate kinase [Candidatus Thiodiazotropha lotti]MCW4183355.1 PfkB family carbohydrate kinase [Candidatus Thiodiazotropha weberae]
MRILAVGVATLDIVNRVEAYPQEDQEIRAISQSRRRGGNACNSLTVLSRLGHSCSWAGVMADDEASRFILDQLQAVQIDTRWVRVESGGITPISYITSSEASGSRTIVHHRQLSEFSEADFTEIELQGYDWVHFEGRNPQATLKMLKQLRQRADLPVSLELEKPRPGLEQALPYVDVVMLSRAYSMAKGMADARQLFDHIRPLTRQALCYLAWGEHGSWMLDRDGGVHFEQAVKPAKVVDTLGAGDVFNAGVIHALLEWGDPLEALRYGNRMAGEKCGRDGI